MIRMIRHCLAFYLCILGLAHANSYESPIDLALLDYDNTIEPTKTELSLRSADHLYALLRRGVDIAVITAQHRERIESCLVKPLMTYLQEQDADLSLLEQLHVFPSGGQEYYQVDKHGLQGPLYKIGLSPEKISEIRKIISNKTTCTKFSDRNTFLSLNFSSTKELVKVTKLFSKDQGVEVHRYRYPEEPKYGYFIHIRSPGFSKSYARKYILEQIKPKIESKKNRKIPLAKILVAGDKMGTSEGENDDLGLIIPGAINLALGKEAADGCEQTYLDKYENGLAKWLEHYRYANPHNDDPCPTLNPQTIYGIHKLAHEVLAATSEDDLVVFIGQTPAYIFPLVEVYRQVKQIAISRTKPAKTINPNQEQLDSFCSYLDSEGLNSQVLKSKKLVLFDHSYRGHAIKTITKLLSTCAKSTDPIKFRFINFASELHLRNNKISSLDDYEFINLERVLSCNHDTMMTIANKQMLPRIVSDYPCENWLNPPAEIDNDETRSCIDKIKQFGI
ncbi:MAG: hypothetical protein AB8G05_25870 [Oligoflexales bacterium]